MTDHPAYFSPIAASMGRSGFLEYPPDGAVDGQLTIQTKLDIDLEAAGRALFILLASDNSSSMSPEQWAESWDDGHVSPRTKQSHRAQARAVIDAALAKVT